ncbi:hypothetical protein BUALT_Bualt11G0123600 [Buddleja alternifolia]|uniref:glutathione transferase n=1 Tax=Buddleja alternifolia TaxID=168488 RepID=A0AAV6WVV5_9LAMI|nr:hypothetical protein BUALT_Bualt11G0123600 [Buddleja alternifolia]
MAEVKLFGASTSPFSRRVEMALKLKGVEYEFIEEDLKNKSPLLLKYNPIHKKVPVLLHNGKPIVESLIIIEYIDETWEGPSILPEDPYERAMARFWAKLLDEKLLGAWGSPFSRRVEMALKLKGVEYEYIEEDLNNKSPLLLKYNPIHKKVPVLVHNGKPIAESLIIIEYIDEVWEGPSILPQDPYERAMARFWVKFLDEKCMPAMWKAFWSTGEEREKNKDEAIEHLKFLESEIKGVELITDDKFPNLSKWADEYINSSFVKENLPDKDKITAFFNARIRAPDETKYFPKA